MREIERMLSDPSLKLDRNARVALEDEREVLGDTIEQAKAVAQRRDASREAGRSLASAINDALTTGLSEFVKGKKSLKHLFFDILDKITNEIIDTFVTGFVDAITGRGSTIGTFLEKMGTSIYGNASAMGGAIDASVFGNPFVKASTPAPLPIELSSISLPTLAAPTMPEIGTESINLGQWNGPSKLTKMLSDNAPLVKGLDKVTSPISEVAETSNDVLPAAADTIAKSTGTLSQNLSGFLKGNMTGLASIAGGLFGKLIGGLFADGGHIRGPGTSRSDSILIGASNGEFMINAAATKKNLPLLHAINDGKFVLKDLPKYANGGIIGDLSGVSLIPADAGPKLGQVDMKHISERKGSSTQVFHLNITGDVSRQTRAEILKLIPDIAGGVNAHNREAGIR